MEWVVMTRFYETTLYLMTRNELDDDHALEAIDQAQYTEACQ